MTHKAFSNEHVKNGAIAIYGVKNFTAEPDEKKKLKHAVKTPEAQSLPVVSQTKLIILYSIVSRVNNSRQTCACFQYNFGRPDCTVDYKKGDKREKEMPKLEYYTLKEATDKGKELDGLYISLRVVVTRVSQKMFVNSRGETIGKLM